jgi:uncharacterized protein (UPF0332 family)
MLNWNEWQEKAESSLEAARILLDNGKPVEAVNRAYYAAYQMVTGVLIKIGQTPRPDFGTWSHEDTQLLVATRICHHRSLSRKDQVALKNQRSAFQSLLRRRYQADYGPAGKIDTVVATQLVIDAGRLLDLLKRLIWKGSL